MVSYTASEHVSFKIKKCYEFKYFLALFVQIAVKALKIYILTFDFLFEVYVAG